MRDQLSRVLQVLLGVRVIVFFAVVLVLFTVLSLVLLLRWQGGLSDVSGLRVLLHLNVDLVGLDAVVVVDVVVDESKIGCNRS